MYDFIAEKAIDFTSPEVLAGYLATGILAVIGLLITVFVLKKILYKPLQKVINERQHEVDASLSAHEEREKVIRERETALAEQEQKQSEILEEQRTQAIQHVEQERMRILADAEEQANAKLAEAKLEIEQNRIREEERLYRQAVDLAVTAISRLEDRDVKPEEAAALESTIRSSENSPKEAGLEA